MALRAVDIALRLDLARAGRSRVRRRLAGWWDLLALLRSIDLVGGGSALRRQATDYIAEYQRVVRPLIESVLGSGPDKYLDDAMRESCVKASFMLAAHAETAGAKFRPDLALLGAAFTRVYDDLCDEDGGEDLVRRMADLFQGAAFVPQTPVETLFHRLYRELERRISHARDDPIYPALRALHQAQADSRGQRDPELSSASLVRITVGKGHGGVVLFGLMLPGMRDEEVAVARLVGALIQLCDDYQDVAVDRRAGISTLATRGELSLDLICRLVRDVRPALVDCYRRHQPLSSVLYLYLWLGFFRRRMPQWLALSGRLKVVTSFAGKRDRR